MPKLCWVHEDALGSELFEQLEPDCQAVFVWDQDYLQKMGYGFQRLVFIYERLCELPVEIYAGSIPQVLSELLGPDGCLVVQDTVNPELQAYIEALQASHQVRVSEPQPFVNLERAPSLRRFFAYWKKARKLALTRHGGSLA